jgi:hypothetical protein
MKKVFWEVIFGEHKQLAMPQRPMRIEANFPGKAIRHAYCPSQALTCYVHYPNFDRFHVSLPLFGHAAKEYVDLYGTSDGAPLRITWFGHVPLSSSSTH